MLISYYVSVSLQVGLSFRKISLRRAIFGDITQRILAMHYRRFGTTYPSDLKVARNPSKCGVGFVDS